MTRLDDERIFALLGELDHEPPRSGLDAVLAGVDRRARTRERIAAGIALLLVAGGLAWAVPGSPFRGWVRDLLGRRSAETSAPVGPVPPQGTAEAPVSGIAVEPGDSFEVSFRGPQVRGRIAVVTSGESEELELRVLGEPVPIASEPARLVISNPRDSRASYEVRIPASAPLVRVLVGGRPVLTKTGDEIRAAVVDSAGRFEIPLGSGP